MVGQRLGFDNRLMKRIPPHAYFVVSAIFHYLGPAFAVLLFARVQVLGVGLGHGRRDQQAVCQCRRSSTGEEDRSPGVCGQATRWATPGRIGCEQPGQR